MPPPGKPINIKVAPRRPLMYEDLVEAFLNDTLDPNQYPPQVKPRNRPKQVNNQSEQVI